MTFSHSGHNSKINLSAQEMLEISQEISRDFTPCFSSRMPERVEKTTKFSSSELLDISAEISRDFAPKLSSPIPELMLLPVDPGHIYAYWNLAQNVEPVTANPPQLTLRVYAQPEEKMATSQVTAWFDVAIDNPKTQQQLALPDSLQQAAYSAAIGRYNADDYFIVLAHSNIIHTPRSRVMWHQDHENIMYCSSKNTAGQGVSHSA